uniref:Uncharacterized protein n=1 Tax=Arundo donax TaxID=35708 RepID=A0A0A9HGG4_ARUDO
MGFLPVANGRRLRNYFMKWWIETSAPSSLFSMQ